jgi:hypothetical protein
MSGAFQPVEPVRAEQDEMNYQRQHEKEGEQGDKRPARIKNEPNLVEFHVDLLNNVVHDGHRNVASAVDER